MLARALFTSAAVAASTFQSVAAENLQKRLKHEAVALFQVILGKNGQRGRCSLASQWLNYPVPREVARKHLGLTLHADLVAPHHATTPAEVLDPSGVMRDAFCDEKQAEQWTTARVEDFRSGTLQIEKSPPYSEPQLVIARKEYSFPVFDRRYRRAIVVVSSHSRNWSKNPEGGLRRPGLEMQGVAGIYAKRNGAWRLVTNEPLFSGH